MSGLHQQLEDAFGLFREMADACLMRSVASQDLTGLENPEEAKAP